MTVVLINDELSVAWEDESGYDSIPTIERVYDRTPSGAYLCCWPGCKVARRDAGALWVHVHTAHTVDSCLPPDGYKPISPPSGREQA